MVRVGRELARTGKPEYETVVKSMEADGDEDVRLAALYALQNMGDAEALKTLISLYDKSEGAKLKARSSSCSRTSGA